MKHHQQALSAALSSHRFAFALVDSFDLVCACLIELGRTEEASKYVEQYIKKSTTTYRVARGCY